MSYKGNDAAALRSIANRQLTKSMQTLLGICTGIAADNHINDQEVHFLNGWIKEYSDVSNIWPASVIAERVRNILEDGIITDEDRCNLLEVLKQITGNHFMDTGSAQHEIVKLPFDIIPLSFTKRVFCFTGEFVSGTRNYCRKITEQLGAITINNMSKKVNYLVIGGLGSPDWVHESFGHKIAHAIRLREIQHPISIIAEKHWHKSTQECP